MKEITLTFDKIVELRKFEGSLCFLGIPHTLCDKSMSIMVNPQEIKKTYKIEISSGSAAISFKNPS